jgi:D-alanine-D-alanine ligase-like ATP-grasp enzyme
VNVVIACNTTLTANQAFERVPESVAHHLREGGVFRSTEDVVAYGQAIRAGTGHGSMDVEADAYLSGSILAMKPDIVFNLASGIQGLYREAYTPISLDNLGVPYTGSDALTASICQDKHATKALLRTGRLPVPRGIFVASVEDAAQEMNHNEFPVILKPNAWSGSIGIHQRNVIHSQGDLIMLVEELLEEGLGPFIVEEYIEGRDIVLSFLGEHMMRPIEVHHDKLTPGTSIFDWPNKQLLRTNTEFAESSAGGLAPAAFQNQRLAENIEAVGLRVMQQLNLRDWGTIDIRLGNDGVPYVIDVNPLPDLRPDPILQTPMGAAIMATGISFEQAVQFVLDSAIARHGLEETVVEQEQLGLELE